MTKNTISRQLIKDEEVKKIVIARLRSLPSEIKISLGFEKGFSKDELIKRVEKQDEVGEKIIQMQLEYLQSLRDLYADHSTRS